MVRPLKNEDDDINKIINIISRNYHGLDYEKDVLDDVELSFSEKEKQVLPEFYVLEIENKIVGFGAIKKSFGEVNVAEAWWFNVLPEKQGLGHGKRLMEELMDMVKKQGIEFITMTCEKKNKGLYENLGFKVIFEKSKGNCFMTKVHGGENKENKPFCNTVKAQNNKIFSRN